MRRDPWPDVLEVWGVTWTKQGQVWVGPAIADPEDPMLALAVACERIVRRDGRYVMVDPSRALDRFIWADGELGEESVNPEAENAP
jgi:hypothetical protein